MTEIGLIAIHFFIGFAASFIGSVPPAAINLTIIQISLSQGLRAALWFALGATLLELVYGKVALYFASWILQNKVVEVYITMLSVPVFLILAWFSFRAKPDPQPAENEAPVSKNAFWYGAFLGLINPLNIPFWVLWGTNFIKAKWIRDEEFWINVFIAGIVCGTLALLVLVAMISRRLQKRFSFNTAGINRAIGYVFLILSLYNIYLLMDYYFINPVKA